jgi:hypothetical protein
VAPTLFINPRTDAEFVELVMVETAAAGSPDELRSRLSTTYPDVIVRERALEGESSVVWYVYRDGRWVAA